MQIAPAERTIVIADSIFLPTIVKQALANVLLKTLQVRRPVVVTSSVESPNVRLSHNVQASALAFISSELASLLPLRQSTALFVDMGARETRIVPVCVVC